MANVNAARLRSRVLCVVLALATLGTLGPSAAAQELRLLPVEDWAYDVIKRLQRRGHLLELHPTAQPYRRGEVAEALAEVDTSQLSPAETHWVTLLRRYLGLPSVEQPTWGASFEVGARVTDNERLDPVRPLGDTLHAYPYADWQLYLELNPFVAQIGARHDLFYDRDPDGLDTALRLLGRSENTYAGFHSRLFSAYFGRFSRNWGVHGETAVLVSDNPRSQDGFSFRLGGERLFLEALLTELDSITEDGRFTGRVADDTVLVGNRRRFLAAHRWDWRPSRHVALTFMESALYSGPGSGISLRYLNPLHPFVLVVDNTPKNDENNGLVGGMLWARFEPFTLHGQLMFDDIDFLGKGDELPSFAASGALIYTSRSFFDAGVALEAVAARTYNTHQPEGRYLYLMRGLATQFSDYLQLSVFSDLYLDAFVPGLRITPQLLFLAQGERDLRQDFPLRGGEVDWMLDGVVERTLRPAVEIYYQPVTWWWVRLDAGVNVVTNTEHRTGVESTRFSGLISFGLRLSGHRPVRLSF